MNGKEFKYIVVNGGVLWGKKKHTHTSGIDRQRRQRGTSGPEREDGIGVKRPGVGVGNRESRPRESGEQAREMGSTGPGPDGSRGHRTRAWSAWSRGLPRRAPGEGRDRGGDTGSWSSASLRTPRAYCVWGEGGLVGPPETWRSQRLLGRFRTRRHPPHSPASAPCPWPRRSRGDLALEKPPRQAPRLDAAKWETGKCHGSAKPKCENSVSR